MVGDWFVALQPRRNGAFGAAIPGTWVEPYFLRKAVKRGKFASWQLVITVLVPTHTNYGGRGVGCFVKRRHKHLRCLGYLR